MRKLIPLSLAAAAATAVTAGAVATAPAADAASATSCPARPGAIVATGGGRVWHRGAKLYACTTAYGHRPRDKYMGPWSPNTRVSFDGANLAWTVRQTAQGKRTDRVWAGNVDSGKRWMLGQKPDPSAATLAGREDLVRRIVAVDRGIAWVTAGGAVMGALEAPDSAPTPVGGLTPKPYAFQTRLLVLGRWSAVPVADLASSLRLVEEEGEGDECGAVNPYVFTVRPDAAKDPVGARWSGYWQSTNCR